MSARGGFGDPQFLTRRIPPNPKYQHIKTRLDTGNSLSKYMEKLEEIKRNYRYKKDELFKRLKVTTFAQLVLQVASLSNESLEVTKEELPKLPGAGAAGDDGAGTNGQRSPEGTDSPVLFLDSSGAGESLRSTLQSVISGVGELDVEKDSPKKEEQDSQARERPYPDCPFLLLDVRDRDAYEQCHIVGAYSYPIATLSRTMNPYTNNILEYKNAHGKIIIVYDNDERLASQAATTMCERGFENLFMLSGGRLSRGLSAQPAQLSPQPGLPQQPLPQQDQRPEQALEIKQSPAWGMQSSAVQPLGGFRHRQGKAALVRPGSSGDLKESNWIFFSQ
nr:centrosomal protein of 41 kDa [Zonotrichia albicollis]